MEVSEQIFPVAQQIVWLHAQLFQNGLVAVKGSLHGPADLRSEKQVPATVFFQQGQYVDHVSLFFQAFYKGFKLFGLFREFRLQHRPAGDGQQIHVFDPGTGVLHSLNRLQGIPGLLVRNAEELEDPVGIGNGGIGFQNFLLGKVRPRGQSVLTVLIPFFRYIDLVGLLHPGGNGLEKQA